jgi:prevent-host-death family protein
MKMTNIREAKSQHSNLVDRALEGEEVIVARAGKPVVRLASVRGSGAPRRGGPWK